MTVIATAKTILNWSTFGRPLPEWDGYTAPELRVPKVYLQGVCEGKPITTSRIISCVGRLVVTRSGSRYHLAGIDPEFRRWLRKEGWEYDPRQPITIKNGGSL